MRTKSLDTPTIDLDQIILDFWLNATNSSTPQPYQTAKGQAKQALLQWHKSKARSYVPEKLVRPVSGANRNGNDVAGHGIDYCNKCAKLLEAL